MEMERGSDAIFGLSDIGLNEKGVDVPFSENLKDKVFHLLDLEDAKQLPDLPSDEEYWDRQIELMKRSPKPEDAYRIVRSPNKGRIIRAIRGFKPGEIITMEHPLLRVSECPAEDETSDEGDDALDTSSGSSEAGFQPTYDIMPNTPLYDSRRFDGTVRTYHPKAVCNSYEHLITTGAELAVATDAGCQSDYVTLADKFLLIDPKVRESLRSLYAVDPRKRTLCEKCSSLPPGSPKDSFCPECRSLKSTMSQDVVPLLQVLGRLGIPCKGALADEIVHACLALSINCFETGEHSIAIFPTLCMCAHSCMPNAIWEWSPLTHRMKLTCLMEIHENEEITVSYISDDDIVCPRSMRRLGLESSHMFRCTCERCVAEDPLVNLTLDPTDPSVEDSLRYILADLHDFPWKKPLISEIQKGSRDLIGPALQCVNCGYSWYDMWTPTIPPKMPSTNGHVSNVLPLSAATMFGMPCPKCGYANHSDRYRRNELTGMWIAALEEPSLFVNPAKNLESPTLIIGRLVELVRFCLRTSACSFLTSMFLDLLAITLFNTGIQPLRGILLFSASVRLLRTDLYGTWIDPWLVNSHWNMLRTMCKWVGMDEIADLINKHMWHLNTMCGTNSFEELKNSRRFEYPPLEVIRGDTITQMDYVRPFVIAESEHRIPESDAIQTALHHGITSERGGEAGSNDGSDDSEEEEEESTETDTAEVDENGNPKPFAHRPHLDVMTAFSERLSPIGQLSYGLKRFHWLRNGVHFPS